MDEAWAAVEAVLPDGWHLRGIELDLWGLTHQPAEHRWFAVAGSGIEEDRPHVIESELADTPAEALNDLARLLRESA